MPMLDAFLTVAGAGCTLPVDESITISSSALGIRPSTPHSLSLHVCANSHPGRIPSTPGETRSPRTTTTRTDSRTSARKSALTPSSAICSRATSLACRSRLRRWHRRRVESGMTCPRKPRTSSWRSKRLPFDRRSRCRMLCKERWVSATRNVIAPNSTSAGPINCPLPVRDARTCLHQRES